MQRKRQRLKTVALGVETGAPEADAGAAEGEVLRKAKGGPRAGPGRLGADADAGARRVEGRHEALAVGQRCPVCGPGNL